ncbi:MAG: MFS transporter [Fimbriimonadaceae bacterium]|nr:MFS transporter [Fimbriimonadaceae bacterium]
MSDRLAKLPITRALAYPDFRLLWFGALFSFSGSWVQKTAQDWVSYSLTNNNEFMLGLVAFCGMAPVSFLAPIMGAYVDVLDRRKLLVILMVISALGPAFLGFASLFGWLQYWHIVVVALVGGFVSTMEMPARQSVVRQAVPTEVLPSAIPAQAMTFNFARIFGPALGGLILLKFGAAWAFFVNAFSFSALIFAVIKIKADLGPSSAEPQPIRDLIQEGFLYTFQNKDLKRLFFMEGITSVFGVFYLSLMAAIAKTMLGLGEAGLGSLFSAVGVGAITGLITVGSISHKPLKSLIVKCAMSGVAIGLILLSLVQVPALAYACVALTGACTIMQFNTTNTLFQLIAPSRLRGRVLAMHMWAVSGLAPVGVLAFGAIAHGLGVRYALGIGGTILLIASAIYWIKTRDMRDPELTPSTA